MTPPVLTLEDMRLTILNGGNFRLDGGVMHGVVPKTLWSKLVSCDALNRCEYSTTCVLVEVAGRHVLIETGNGDKFCTRLKDIYGIDHDRAIGRALAEIGVAPCDIDMVVMTHLHFDHSGGTTRATASGGLEPVFTRARHVIQRREWEDATHPHERNRASYRRENLLPLEAAGLIELVNGEVEISPGVRVIPTPGHTAGHQSVLIGPPDGPKALFLGDVVPTSVHVRLPWTMSYDLEPARTIETKRSLFTRALAEDWLLVWGHDKDHIAGRLGLDEDGAFSVRDFI